MLSRGWGEQAPLTNHFAALFHAAGAMVKSPLILQHCEISTALPARPAGM
jgi:hypothetical protein